MSQVLSGIRILVTRPIHQANALVKALEAHGAKALIHPTIELHPTQGSIRAQAMEMIKPSRVGDYHGLLFCSANAVLSFVDALHELEMATSAFDTTTLFCVGPATQRVALAHGFSKGHLPSEYTADGLLKFIRSYYGSKLSSKSFLLPRAQNGRNNLLEGLRQGGANVTPANLYETIPIQSGPPLPDSIDWITFTSPSAIQGFVHAYGTDFQYKVACIGAITQQALEKHNLRADALASEATIPSLIRAIVEVHAPTKEHPSN